MKKLLLILLASTSIAYADCPSNIKKDLRAALKADPTPSVVLNYSADKNTTGQANDCMTLVQSKAPKKAGNLTLKALPEGTPAGKLEVTVAK